MHPRLLVLKQERAKLRLLGGLREQEGFRRCVPPGEREGRTLLAQNFFFFFLRWRVYFSAEAGKSGKVTKFIDLQGRIMKAAPGRQGEALAGMKTLIAMLVCEYRAFCVIQNVIRRIGDSLMCAQDGRGNKTFFFFCVLPCTCAGARAAPCPERRRRTRAVVVQVDHGRLGRGAGGSLRPESCPGQGAMAVLLLEAKIHTTAPKLNSSIQHGSW